MDVAEVSGALSNATRLRLIKIISEKGPMPSKQAHKEFTQRYDSHRRESIYKALETLVDAEILIKYYDQEGDGIVYDLAIQKLLIDLVKLEIQEVDTSEVE